MKLINLIRLFTSLVLIIGTSSGANAGILTGDTVTIELWSSKNGGTSYGVQNVVVGPGDDGNYFGNQQFDLDYGFTDDIFSVKSSSTFGSIDGAGGTIEWRLSGLDFIGGALLTGTNFVQSYSNVSISSLGRSNVTYSYADSIIPKGIYFQAQFITRQVPEPSIIALFAAGLFGIGFARRRQS